jgi:Cu2+-exporting ATPase
VAQAIGAASSIITSIAPRYCCQHELVPEELQQLALYDHASIQKSFVIERGGQVRQASLILEGITCAACVWLNERHLRQLDGVREVQVNYASHRARITWDDEVIKLSRILQEIQLLGYNAHPYSAERHAEVRTQQRARDLRRIDVAGLCAAQVMMIASRYTPEPPSAWSRAPPKRCAISACSCPCR